MHLGKAAGPVGLESHYRVVQYAFEKWENSIKNMQHIELFLPLWDQKYIRLQAVPRAVQTNLQKHSRYNHKWGIYDWKYFDKVCRYRHDWFIIQNGIFILLRTLKERLKSLSLGLCSLNSLGLDHNTLQTSLFIIQGLRNIFWNIPNLRIHTTYSCLIYVKLSWHNSYCYLT